MLQQRVTDAVIVECMFLTSALNYNVHLDRLSDDDGSGRVVSINFAHVICGF